MTVAYALSAPLSAIERPDVICIDEASNGAGGAQKGHSDARMLC